MQQLETVPDVLLATNCVDIPVPTLPPSTGPVVASLTVSVGEDATAAAATTSAAASSSVPVGHSSDTATVKATQITPSAATG